VLIAVEWENRKNSNVHRTGGNIASDQATIYIPFSLGANYLSPKTWQALLVKTGKFTFQVGDVIVKGSILDEIHDAVVGPPAVTAFTLTNLKSKYDDVLVISSVDEMDMGSLSMQHWKLSAK
jgi:hypothetical protein